MSEPLVQNGTSARGALMAAEIAEQPAVWARLLREGRAAIDAVAREVHRYTPRFVLFVARGTSDHAALYAKYLVEIRLGLPAGLASPSTMGAYGARPDLSDVLMIGISQSGGSPDLVHSMRVGRAQGALTVAVTNNPGSALDDAAELAIPVLAGPEHSVAATKSYTAQLLSVFLLLEAIDGRRTDAVHQLPDWGAEVLALRPAVAEAATRYRYAQRMVLTGRGYAYPTAREAALKLTETCYLSAHAFSGADLLHGPFAMIDPQVPVLTVAPDGVAGTALEPVHAQCARTGADGAVDAERADFLRTQAADLRRRQSQGEIPDDLDPAHLLLALLAMSSAPTMLPHVVRRTFGMDPDSEEFREQYAGQVARLVRRITVNKDRLT